MVATDNRRARNRPIRSPVKSVTPALSIATSVPPPIAIPTSAAASAGASLTPSPTIADTTPIAAQPLHHLAFALRQHAGLDLFNAERRRNRAPQW